MKKAWKLAASALFLALFASGCGALRLETPDEYKMKKMREDPPVSLNAGPNHEVAKR